MRIKYTLKSNIYLLKKVIKYNKLLFLLRIIISILNSISILLTILMPMFLLDAIIAGDLNEIIITLLIFTVAFLCINCISVIFSKYDKVSSEKIYVEIINEFLQKTIDLDLGYFDNTESYDKYNRAFGNCCRAIDTVNAIITSFVTSIFNLILITSVLIWMNLYMFIAIVVIIIVNFIIGNKTKKIDYYYSKLFSEKNKQVNYLYRLFYIPQLVRETKANNLSKFIFENKQNFNDDIIQLTKKQTRTKALLSILTGSINTLESGFVALYFGFSVVIQRIVISEYFTSVNAYNQLKSTILNIVNIYTNLYSNSLFASDYIDFLNSNETVTLNETGEELQEVRKIEFSNVSFKYPNNTYLSLDNVSFKINKGEKVAIVGKNGAGKTTIIKLLLRLYDPLSGTIYINDVDIKRYTTKSLRTVIQTLFQDFAIYAFSIKDNITLGKSIDDSVIWDALDKVDLTEKIKNLKYSIDTPITSQLYADGIELSGGEAQKLAIARIYANGPKTFIMDEPTSNLDPYAEYLLYDRLIKDTTNDSTVIVISHRLTLTYKMSKVIVIDQGRVTEEGTHEELMNLKRLYYDMYTIQSEKYVDTKNNNQIGGK